MKKKNPVKTQDKGSDPSALRAANSALEEQKILIVDDRKENLVALRRTLGDLDAEVFEATTGNQALAATLDHDFALAILDVMMPGMSGYELAEHLRGDNKTRAVPIVFVTASHMDEQQIFKGYEAGGIDYIVKPFAPEILLGKVRIFLEMDRYRREMRRHRDHLDTLVTERTAELAEANTELLAEITERQRAEEALELAVSRWESTFDAVEDMVAVIDTDYRILLANRAMKERFKGQNVLGGFCYELIHGTDSPPETCLACKVFETGEPQRWEIQEEHLGGCWLDVASSPIKDEAGKVRQIVHSVQDITERKRAEQEIENLAKFPSESPDPVLRIAKDGTIIFANNAAHPLLDAWSSQDQQGAVLPGEWSKLAGDVLVSGQREDIEDEHSGRTFLVTFAPVVEAGYVNLYARDITRRKQVEEQLLATLEETVNALASAVEQRDPYTAGHQRRVAQLACAIAKEMGLGGERIDGLRLAGVIHDVGKISVPAEILSKPTRLTEMEFNIIKTHSQAGHDVLKKIRFPWPIAEMVLQHHERMDGSGYPQGISGDQILLEARILAVADVVEAMSSHRPYRPALGMEEALSEISEARGTLYDPDVVDACLKLFREKDFKFE